METTSTTSSSAPVRQGGSSKTLWVILGVVVVLGLWAITSYNSLVRANEAVTTQWSQVESQYQRRFDLIPGLVESVKGIFNQEQEVFTAIAEARKGYAGAQTVDQKVQAAGAVESALGRLLVITENYPQLKSNEALLSSMAAIEGTENRIAVERGRYNETVQTYNVKVRSFPGSIFAGMFGFAARPQFEAVNGAETAPTIKY